MSDQELRDGFRDLANRKISPPPAAARTKKASANTAEPGDQTTPDAPASSGGVATTKKAPAKKRAGRVAKTASQDSKVGDDEIELPGRKVGNKRIMVSQIPLELRRRIDVTVEENNTTLGVEVMRALRVAHTDLTKQIAAEQPDLPDSPFPAERRPRRRRDVVDPVSLTFTVHDDEARAVATVAKELQMSISELVTRSLEIALN